MSRTLDARSAPFTFFVQRAGDAAFAGVSVAADSDVAALVDAAIAKLSLGVPATAVTLALAAGGARELPLDATLTVAEALAAGALTPRAKLLATVHPHRTASAAAAYDGAPGGAAAGGVAAASTRQAQFWAALGGAELDVACDSLTLADGVEWGGAVGGGRVMLVRGCYARLAEAVAASRCALVRGTPGIGKSMFAFFFAWRALRHGAHAAVVYDYAVEESRRLRVIVEGGAARNVKPRLLEGLLCAESTLYIADGVAPSQAACRTLVVASPKRDVWKEWAKACTVDELFVPPFDADEVERARALAFPGLDADAVARAFDVWGGSARLVLRQHAKAAAPAFQRALAASLSFDALERTVHDLAAAGGASADTPQSVVHMVPDDDSLRSFHLRFASRHMRDVFYDLLQRAGEARIRGFIAAAETSPAMWSLRGQVFERFALGVICRRGTAVLIELCAGARGAAASEALVDRRIFVFGRVDDAAAEVRRCAAAGETLPLCRPRAANFPTWDAAVVDDAAHLTLFQVTVSDTHDVKAQGLVLASVFGELSSGAVRLVFVVPRGGGPAHAARMSGATPRWLAGRGVVQFVLEVDMAPAIMALPTGAES